MTSPVSYTLRALLPLLLVATCMCDSACCWQESSNRQTPLVKAVATVRPSVVNLRGKKTVRTTMNGLHAQAVKQVNGMGTGVIIDPSGYILTNYHVVEDVRRIQVTLHDRTTTTGTLLAHDQKTDLALVKINTTKDLPVIPMGTSTDVMLAETVAALGNAYGYEDTITRGIVSEIGRTVQVNERQTYENLIQTDASINPGNSGGPLINLDGEMIGINVAVRVGAQGIAFAIPVNEAIEVAARMLAELSEKSVHHGIAVKTVYENHKPVLQVQSVEPGSSAAKAGLEYGDIIKSVNGLACERAIDFQRSLLDGTSGEELKMVVDRHGDSESLVVSLDKPSTNFNEAIWKQLGVKVTELDENALKGIHTNYQRGLQIEQVRVGSPADREGMKRNDVLVAMHGWKTETVDNLLYILGQGDVRNGSECVFYILRDKEPYFGNIRIR